MTKPKHLRRVQPGKWSAIDKISHEKIRLLIMDGWSDTRIAHFFGLSRKGWEKYKNKWPKFFGKLKDWRAEAAKQVEKSMFKVAKGFEYEEKSTEKDVWTKRDGSKVSGPVKIKRTKKMVTPSVEAGKFILTNHMPETYKNRSETKNTNLNGTPDDKEFTKKFFGLQEED